MDNVSRKKRSEIMSKIRGKRTKLEMAVHGWLKGLKVRHKMWPKIYGNPDILIYPNTLVFVNGCFWHGCRKHFKCPKTRKSFWTKKITRNRERQREVFRVLKALRYKTEVIWEHDLR